VTEGAPEQAAGPQAGTTTVAGWRVLVPRPSAGSSAAEVALAAVGAVPVVVPLVETVPPQDPTPLDDALLALGAGWYPWLVVTSAAAVPVLDARAEAAGRTLASLVADRRASVAAVGPGTARALRAAGVEVDLVPRGPSTASSLVAAFPRPAPSADGRPARVLFPRGDLAAPTLADGLRSAGWQVDDVVTYRTVDAPPPPEDVRAAWASGEIRAALLTSASTVRRLDETLGRPPAGTLLVAIGPTTRAELETRGLPVAAVAREQTMAGIVAALVDAAGRAATTATAAGDLDAPTKEDR